MSFNYTQQVHCLTISEPVQMSPSLGVLPAGEWLVTDLNAFELAQKARRGTAKVKQWVHAENNESKNTLVIRQGAWGDLLLLSPLFKEWMLQTNSVFDLCCFPKYFPLFEGERWIGERLTYPFNLANAGKYKEIISLENTMESDHEHHATDVFARALGLDLTRKSRKLPEEAMDYRPRYIVRDEEKAATSKHLFANRPNIVIQMRASIANRDYPIRNWGQVIQKLEQRGWGVLLVGSKGQIPALPPELQTPFIRDLSVLGLTFRESAAVLAQAQAFVGVDSAWSHMCHALDIPAVVLFGPFHWTTRTSKAPKTIAIQGVGPCSPCNWHIHAGQMFPPNKPCSRVHECVVLAGISPDRIIAKCDLMKP